MKVTAFFVLVLGVMLFMGAVSGYFPPPSLTTMWLGGLTALYLMVSTPFLIKKRGRWMGADLLVLLFLSIYFTGAWILAKRPFPYSLMSLPTLFVTAVFIVSFARELKKRS